MAKDTVDESVDVDENAVSEDGVSADVLSMNVPFMISLPLSMRIEIEKRAAAEDNTAPSSYARDILADALGITLTTKGRARKYASEQDRLDAQKRKNEERRDKMNAALKAQRAKLGLPD